MSLRGFPPPPMVSMPRRCDGTQAGGGSKERTARPARRSPTRGVRPQRQYPGSRNSRNSEPGATKITGIDQALILTATLPVPLAAKSTMARRATPLRRAIQFQLFQHVRQHSRSQISSTGEAQRRIAVLRHPRERQTLPDECRQRLYRALVPRRRRWRRRGLLAVTPFEAVDLLPAAPPVAAVELRRKVYPMPLRRDVRPPRHCRVPAASASATV